MNKQLKKLMNMSIQYEKFVKRKGNGDKQYDPVSTLDHVFVNAKTMVVTDLKGVEYVSKNTIYIDFVDMPTISGDDQFIWYGTKYPVKSFAPITNLKGNIEVWEVHI